MSKFFKALEEAGTGAADINEFVPLKSVDPVYFDKAYYLGPDKGGAKPYALLARALRESGRCAIGRWAARGKQYIVMIRPVANGLVMQQLLYADEVRSIKDIDIPKLEVKETELKLAHKLIEQQSSEKFDPSQYTDDVRERIEKAIEKKVEGQEISVAPAETVEDLKSECDEVICLETPEPFHAVGLREPAGNTYFWVAEVVKRLPVCASTRQIRARFTYAPHRSDNR